MIDRLFPALGVLATILVVSLTPVAAQSRSDAADPTLTPQTPNGHPNLRGVWDFRTVTPLERPSELAGKEFLTDEEAAAYETRRVREQNADLNRESTVTDRRVVNGTTETSDLRLAYNDFWWDRGTRVVGTRRTSLVIDPPDGRVPALTPEGRSRAAARSARSERPTEGPEDRSLSERCITGFNSGPPMLSGGYNQNVQIFQTADYVVLFHGEVGPRRTEGARAEPLRFPYRKVMETSGATSFLFEGETRPELRMLFDDYADPGSVSVALRALGLPPARGRQPEASTITGYRWDRGSFEWEDYSQGHLTVRRSDRPQREAICVWKITIRPREEAR